MAELKPCPHCNKTNEVYRNVRAYGWCEEHFDDFGDQASIQTDGLMFTNGRTFRCMFCSKIRIDVIETKDGLTNNINQEE